MKNCLRCEAEKVFATKMYMEYIAGAKTFSNEADEVILLKQLRYQQNEQYLQ